MAADRDRILRGRLCARGGVAADRGRAGAGRQCLNAVDRAGATHGGCIVAGCLRAAANGGGELAGCRRALAECGRGSVGGR
ncbi:hypothetical protein CFB45_18215 [Burkholderia sp. HI2500]|nr:hypothetical protein CFB45_18215 [Burkholderia sp. HI2500]